MLLNFRQSLFFCICLGCGAWFFAIHAQVEPLLTQRRRFVRSRVRVDAHVLSESKLDADRPLRSQPQRPHQQRQLLVANVDRETRAEVKIIHFFNFHFFQLGS